MKKIERVYREILYQTFEKKTREMTQKFLSEKCRVSIGNVNYALKVLENMNSIEKKLRKFLVLNPKKILVYWASIRNLKKDIIYSTNSQKDLRQTESEMPPCMFTAYSGYKLRFGEPPAGYSEVYVYDSKESVKSRFPKREGKDNIFVLNSDEHLESFKEVPLAQMYVDLWNLETWYAHEFIKKLEEIIDGILER